MSSWFDELDEAALLLGLTPRAIPMEAARFLHVDDPDIARVVNFGITRSHPLDLHLPQYRDPPELVADSLSGLLPAFQKLTKRDKARFRLAVDGSIPRSDASTEVDRDPRSAMSCSGLMGGA